MSDISEPTPPSGDLIWPPDAAPAENAADSHGERGVDSPGDESHPAAGHQASVEPGTAEHEPSVEPGAEGHADQTGDEPEGPASGSEPPGSQVGQPPAGSEVAAEPETSDENADGWTPGEHDLIPLLPRGTPLFDGIPSEALVLEALCPAIGNGAIVVRRPEAVGVVLVKDGSMFEKYAFRDDARMLGDGALAEISGWQDALVSAFKFDPLIVAVAPSLLRGDPLYEDLRLAWADWSGLLADLCSRDGSYVVELDTPLGRGVTCILDGRQVATYTDSHPEFGEESLLDPLAATRQGTIWVRREPSIADESAAELAAAAPPGDAAPWQERPAAQDPGWSSGTAQPESPQPWEAGYVHPGLPWQQPAPTPYGPGPHPPDLGTQAAAGYPAPYTAGQPPAAPDRHFGAFFEPAPGRDAARLAELAPELKLIARARLQRSAARVETMIDEAVAHHHSLDAVLNDIRGLVIRGVMQSTLDEVVDDMAARAGRQSA